MPAPTRRVAPIKVRAAGAEVATRTIPEEVPVALVYDGSTHAVMMATPADLEDFAVGFSLTEGIVSNAADIREIEIVEHDNGLEARVWLAPASGRAHAERRRRITGPTSCGLCGVESLEAAVPKPPRVTEGGAATREDIVAALAALGPAQTLNAATHAVHGAAFWTRERGLVHLREDVGRHNALDKLVGAMARAGDEAKSGLVLLTSRVSVEMVQKTAALGAPIMVAISAPTALALRTAEEAGITVVAVARPDAFEIFTHPRRIAVSSEAGNAQRSETHEHALQH